MKRYNTRFDILQKFKHGDVNVLIEMSRARMCEGKSVHTFSHDIKRLYFRIPSAKRSRGYSKSRIHIRSYYSYTNVSTLSSVVLKAYSHIVISTLESHRAVLTRRSWISNMMLGYFCESFMALFDA